MLVLDCLLIVVCRRSTDQADVNNTSPTTLTSWIISECGTFAYTNLNLAGFGLAFTSLDTAYANSSNANLRANCRVIDGGGVDAEKHLDYLPGSNVLISYIFTKAYHLAFNE